MSFLVLAGLLGSYSIGHAAEARPCFPSEEDEQRTAGWYEQCGPKPEPERLAHVFYVPKLSVSTVEAESKVRISPKILVRNDADCRKAIVQGDRQATTRYERCLADWLLEDAAMLRCGYQFDEGRVAYTQVTSDPPRQIEACKRNEKIRLIRKLLPDIRQTCAPYYSQESDEFARCLEIFYVTGPQLSPDTGLRIRMYVQGDIVRYPYINDDRIYGEKVSPPKRFASDPLPMDGCQKGYGIRDTPGGFGGKSCQPLGLFHGDSQEQAPPPVDATTSEGSKSAGNTTGGSVALPSSSGGSLTSTQRRQTAAPVRIAAEHIRPAPRTRTSTITSRDWSPEIRNYDRRQDAVIMSDGRKLSIKPLMAALARVAPQAARAPFVPSANGSLQPSPDLQRAIVNNASQIRQVGGVALDVTFQSLSGAGVRGLDVEGEKVSIENPVLISLRRLLTALEPYTARPGKWETLPDELRYPGTLSRIRGFVLDPVTEDVFLVGTSADRPEDRLDVDLLTVLLDVSWGKGLTPGVSLDPAPAPPRAPAPKVEMASGAGQGRPIGIAFSDRDATRVDDVPGPQMARLINLPSDALASRVLLDADFEMKRINFGLVKIEDPAFRSLMDLRRETSNSQPSRARFWFHPIPLGANTVRVSQSGNVVLFDARLQVLTEDQDGAGAGQGTADAVRQQAVSEFTRAFPQIALSRNVRPAGIFALLLGANDVVTVGSLLRKTGVSYGVLDRFRRLPYRHLAGREAVPASYPGQTARYVDAAGMTWYVSGGVELRNRPNRRSYDQFDDDVNEAMEQSAARFEGQGFVVPLSMTFTLRAQDVSASAAATLSKLAGRKLLAQEMGDAAAEKFRDAVRSDPLDIEGWTLLAVAQDVAKKPTEARASIGQALSIDRHDDQAQRVALRMAIRAEDWSSAASYDESIRRNVAQDYVNTAFAKINNGIEGRLYDGAYEDVSRAIRLWPQSPWAFYVRCIVESSRNEYDAAIRDCSSFISDVPTLLPAYLVRALSYQRKGDPKAARADYDRAVAIDGNSTYALFTRGTFLLLQGEYDAAIRDLNRVVQLDPTDVSAFTSLAGTFWRQKRYPEALARFGDALRLKPANEAQILGFRAAVYDVMGDTAAALRDFDRAEMLEPKRSATFENRGLFRWNRGDQAGAIRDFDRAFDVDPTNVRVLLMRAIAFDSTGRDDQALRDFERAARLAPGSELAWTGQGDIFRERREFAKAIDLYSKAIAVDARAARPFGRRGLAYQGMNRDDLAMGDFNRAIEVDPKFAEAYNNRGGLLEKRGDEVRALNDLNECIRLDPNIAEAFANRAIVYKRGRQIDRAIADLSEAIRIRPDFSRAFVARGNIHLERGDRDRAVQDYDSAIRIDPKNALAYFNRAVVFKETNEIGRALTDLDEVIRLDPQNVDAYLRRGALYLDQGANTPARTDFDQAIRIEPNSPAAYNGRGAALRASNDQEGALSAFSQAIRLKPDYAEAYRNRSMSYEAMGKHALAVDDYRMVRRLDPTLVKPGEGPDFNSPATAAAPPDPSLSSEQIRTFVAAYNEIQALPYDPEATARDRVLKKYGFTSYIEYLNVQRKALAVLKIGR